MFSFYIDVHLDSIYFEGGADFLQKEQESSTMTWKYVDNKTLSTLGLTSGVRKVVPFVILEFVSYTVNLLLIQFSFR